MADKRTGSWGILRVTASVTGSDADALWSDVAWALRLVEDNSPNNTFDLGGTGANVKVGGSTVWSGSLVFDWRPAGNQTTLIASGTTRVDHNPDGTGSTSVVGHMDATGTVGAGGPTSVTQNLTLPTLKVVPGTPTDVSASRVSDTEITVSWSQTSASNGQPTTNSVQRRVNGGAWQDVVTISPSTSTSVAASANQKLEYRVKGTNSAGDSEWSAASTAIYTTPAAPSGVSAAKDAALDINVSWTPHVAFTEHVHVVEHGTVTGGVTTWDAEPLAEVTAGTSTYKHESPESSDVHVYRVSAKNTDTGALQSSKVTSNQVQILVAPDAPDLPTLAPYLDKGKDFDLTWTHNPVDTTAQTAYEVEYSTDGGENWSTTGKVTDTDSEYTFAADTYSADDELTVRVRTWGQATSGGSDGTGASEWSATATVTFKSRPVVTITSPEDEGTWEQADLTVGLGFSQAEDATFVRATIVLSEAGSGGEELETRTSTTLASTLLDTEVEDGGSYTVTVTALDSNGLTSDPVEATFSVSYTLPVAAGVTVTYHRESGIAQLDLTIAEPGEDEVEATAVTIFRTIDGSRETVVSEYPADSSLTILDTTPTIHGTNEYVVRTISADGATADTAAELVTDEDSLAFLSTGSGYSQIVSFFGNLRFAATPARSHALVQTAGRSRPIALFGEAGALQVSGSASIFPDEGSTVQEIEQFILDAGVVCYRDPSGRRMFGTVTGSLDSPSSLVSEFQYTVTEAA